ncbi:MAG TPA: hypothetical protein VFF69_12600 [Phycisphaerales bacterium]|nr:hypothetical protein [Phycisphaerales bacterium]
MRTHESPNRPGRPLRAVVLLLLSIGILAAISAPYLRRGSSGTAGAAQPPAVPAPPRDLPTVMLDFTVATIPELVASQPSVARLLQSIGSASGAQADGAGAQAWLDQLQALVDAKFATIASRPRMAVASGQAARIEVRARAAASASDLEIAVTPEAADGGSVVLGLRIGSKAAEGMLELWAKEAGLSIGPSADLKRDVVVLPGGGVGLAAALRTPLGRDGWLIVIVKPTVIPSAPSITAPPQERP